MPTIVGEPLIQFVGLVKPGWLRNMDYRRFGIRIAKGLSLAVATFALSGCMVVSWRSKVQPPQSPIPTARNAADEARLDMPCASATALKVSMLVTLPVVNRRVGKCQS